MKICKAKVDDKWVKVPFYGVFQYSDVIAPSPMVGGHTGRVIAYPVAVVKIEKKLITKKLNQIKEVEDDRQN